MEVILEYLLNNWPTLTIILIVGFTCFIISRKFTKWDDRHARKHEDLEKGFSDLSDNITHTLSRLEAIEKDLIILKSVLAMKYKNFKETFSLKFSPRRLNENGEKLFSDIKGAEFLEKNKDFLFSQIDALKPKTALDVENAANIACLSNTDNDIFNGLKNFVYNSPTYMLEDAENVKRPYDLDMNDICFVLSLPLRDMYLAEHSEILQE